MPVIAKKMQINVKYLNPIAERLGLSYSTPYAAGLDLRACLDRPFVEVQAGDRVQIATGIAIEILASDVAGFVFSRSGLGAKDGLTIAQGVGLIDPDYRGEILIWLLNTSSGIRRVERGQRVAQLVFLPSFQVHIVSVRDLTETTRGTGAFGHTGTT